MELKHITVFCALYEAGSINRAAQRLNISQPSVSVLIRKLENELGKTLFDRHATGSLPTFEAKILYSHFQRVLADIDAAKKSITGELNDVRGSLRVGLAPTVTKGVLAGFLPQFLDDYPLVDLRITEAFSDRLIQWTLAGELDFSIVALAPADRRLVTRRVASEPVVLISSKSSGRQPGERVDLTKQAPLKLLLPWAKDSLRSVFDNFIHAGEIPIERMTEMDTLWGILDQVRQSDWVTLLSVTAVSSSLDDFIVQEIERPAMTAEFFQIRPARGTLPAAAHKFAAEIEEGFSNSLKRWKMAV